MKVGYARVSTLDQNTELQLDALNDEGCEKIYQEKASGRKTVRPVLTEMLEWMREGDTLVVWKLDRLARSTKQLITTIDDLKERGINFKCLTIDIDTSTPSGNLIFGIFSALSQFEAELTSERINAGLAAAKSRGRIGGRPQALSQQDKEVGQALLDAGKSQREVAKRLNVSNATISRHLSLSNSVP